MSLVVKDILKNDEKINEITKRAFDQIDTDKSGSLDFKELKKILYSLAIDMGAEPPTEDDVQDTLDRLDSDKSGTIEFNEFKVLIVKILCAMSKDDEEEDEENDL